MDPFKPLGKGNMLQAAHMLLHIAHLSGNNQMPQVFNIITSSGAKTLNLGDKKIDVDFKL